MQTERRLPNRVEDSSPFSLPDLRRTGCSTVHYEAAASLIALCPATHLPVTYWPADSAPLIAPLSLPSECCRLALRSQPCNIPPVRRLALRHQRPSQDYTSLIAIGLFLWPYLPDCNRSSHISCSLRGFHPHRELGFSMDRRFGCLSYKASETRRDNYLSITWNIVNICHRPWPEPIMY